MNTFLVDYENSSCMRSPKTYRFCIVGIGSPYEVMASRINELGRKYEVELEDGVKKAYEWFLANYK